VTIGVRNREPVFKDIDYGLCCVDLLRDLRSGGGRIYAYCFMPDHVHLLIGVRSGIALPDLIRTWKSRCYRIRRGLGMVDPFWQRSYFDHAIRDDEDLRAAAEYVLQNPVRAGIARSFREYPLCGSLEFDL
jgi:putative transposase